jgi:hypothetical protein
MEYIVTKRYKQKCLGGNVNLPYGTACETWGNLIVRADNKTPLCLTTSQDAYDFLSRNDDGQGKERGRLVHAILDLLRTPPKEDPKAFALHKERWGRVWAAEDTLGRFRRPEHPDHWVWGFDFYNAEIADLETIYNTVKGA